MFKEVGWFIPESNQMDAEIAHLLKELTELTKEKIASKAYGTKNILENLKHQVLNAYVQITRYGN